MTSLVRQAEARPLGGVPEDAFKSALRSMAATVCVVTARHGGEVSGMTATAVCSVSADPPSVLVVVNRANRSHPVIRDSGRFALHVLSADQSALAAHFASRPDQPFAGVAMRPGLLDCPVIAECATVMECAVACAQEFGTHTIFIGHVRSARTACASPLLYHRGRYGAVISSDSELDGQG